MKKNISKLIYFPVLVIGFITLTAGHHFETKLAQEYPMYDLTDVYCFPSSNKGMTTFILDFNPGASPDSTFHKNFGNKNGYRQLHIGFDKQMKKGISLGFSYSNDKIKIYSTNDPNPKIADIGKRLGKGKLYEPILLDNGMKVWSGIVKDPFNGNGEALYGKLKAAVDKDEWDENAFSSLKGHDLFEKTNVVSIVIDIPNKLLSDNIYYHASSAAKVKGKEKGHDHAHWHRINRIAHVLLPHLYMENMSDREKQMEGDILDDDERRANCERMIEKYSRLSKSRKDPKAYAKEMTKMLLPDFVPYKVGTTASYNLPELNGRKLTDNAMDTALEILIGRPFPNYTDVKIDRFTNTFPYLVSAN